MTRAEPFPLEAVRLTPSIFLDAIETNRKYLLSLEPDRFLHNFRVSAGLAPKGEMYGGWESLGIAGHSLGHYLSACSLMHAQTSDAECARRVAYIVRELAECQDTHGDGYVGGTTVQRDGKWLDGKIVFEEIRRGQFRAGPFDVNGGWVPLYTWHKVHAGLLDAHRYCANDEALKVATKAADYLIGVLMNLTDDQVQQLLAAEHGGLNEAYAETYARTQDRRYLDMAKRIRHRAVLDLIAQGRDVLPGMHANTQIPKIIGLARLHELTGDADDAHTAQFFWQTVVRDHSYVIGGNSEREQFGPPRTVSSFITERTCEACNTYNMLKLTRHLFAWATDARYFDYYERAHLNHIMAAQHPQTGMKVYFMPMSAGAKRRYSTPTDTFWCCVGSGMESHAKHGDSIYWRRGDTLFVNLFIPSTLQWPEKGAAFTLDTAYPHSNHIDFTVTRANAGPMSIAMRLPAWCEAPLLTVNGRSAAHDRRGGYAVLRRRWHDGDKITLTLPMTLRAEPTPDNPDVVAFVSGPLVLAADLGTANSLTYDQPLPAFVDSEATLVPTSEAHTFQTRGVQPAELTLRPFYSAYDRRTAVYFPRVSRDAWNVRITTFATARARSAALDARTVDMIQLGEDAPEAEHNFRTNHSERISYSLSSGRQAWWGEDNYIEFELGVRPGPMTLAAKYWGDETAKDFTILIDDEILASERRAEAPVSEFVTREYPIPEPMTRGKTKVTIRFETHGSDAPVYECRTLAADTPPV